jgi:tetratricopeptide (TPR) repeat protein
MHLIELDNKGLELVKSGHYHEAIKLFEKIIGENPNYEWGPCFFYIADCYEKLRDYPRAKAFYLKSIDYDDEDIIRLKAFASFLLYYDDSEEA